MTVLVHGDYELSRPGDFSHASCWSTRDETDRNLCTPQWDGPESMDSYLRVLRLCYGAFCDRFEARAPCHRLTGKPQRYDLERADYVVFHAPFNRLTRKAVATLAHADRLRCLSFYPAICSWPPGTAMLMQQLDIAPGTMCTEGATAFNPMCALAAFSFRT